MATFQIKGLTLKVPGHALDAGLRRKIESGNYEWPERAAVLKHVTPGDRVLDFGAGAGYVASVAGQIVGGENLVAVEPSPDMQEALRGNLVANGVAGATVLHAAVVPESHAGDTARLNVLGAFWASRLKPAGKGGGVEVPAVRFGALLAEFAPTVVLMDAEGIEAELCLEDMPSVRLLVVELHPKTYPRQAIQRLFDSLSAQGLVYQPAGSAGAVVVFERLDDAR